VNFERPSFRNPADDPTSDNVQLGREVPAAALNGR